MNSSGLARIGVSILILFLVLYLAVDIMTSGGNSLGRVYFYVLIVSAVMGVLSPRMAFFYLIFLTAYLDYFKRLLILDNGVSTQDLYNVLGIAPATISGILFSVLFQALQGTSPLMKGQLRSALITLAITFCLAALGLGAMGRTGRAVGDVVNLVIYIPLVAIIPLLFRTTAEIQKMLKTLMWIYIPAGIYLIYHGFFGITDLEMAYVKSGLTVEIRMLSETVFRPFGTMNSAGTCSMVFSLFAFFALLGPWDRDPATGNISRKHFAFRFFAFAIFASAAACSLTRTGWILGLLLVAAALAFRSRFLTRLFYGAMGVAVTGIFLAAPWLLKTRYLNDLDGILNKAAGSQTMGRLLVTATFSERLKGFEALMKNPLMWTPFGWKLTGRPESLRPFTHDAFGELLLKIGFVPLVLIAGFGIYGIYSMHRAVLGETNKCRREIGVMSLAALFVLIVGCLSNGSQLFMFPINFFLYFFAAATVSLKYAAMRESPRTVTEDKAEADPDAELSIAPYRLAQSRRA